MRGAFASAVCRSSRRIAVRQQHDSAAQRSPRRNRVGRERRRARPPPPRRRPPASTASSRATRREAVVGRRDDARARRHALPATLDRERLERDHASRRCAPKLRRAPVGGALIGGRTGQPRADRRQLACVVERLARVDARPRQLAAAVRARGGAEARGKRHRRWRPATRRHPAVGTCRHLAAADRRKSTRGRHSRLTRSAARHPARRQHGPYANRSAIFATPSAASPARPCSRASRCCRLPSASARTRPSSRWSTRCCCGGCRSRIPDQLVLFNGARNHYGNNSGGNMLSFPMYEDFRDDFVEPSTRAAGRSGGPRRRRSSRA